MPRYLLAFHGGTPPADQHRMADFMGRWQGWAASLGEAVADDGAVLSRSIRVTDAAHGTAEPGPDRLSGFTLLDAADLEAAVQMVRGCPIFEVGGTIEVAELMSAAMTTGAGEDACP